MSPNVGAVLVDVVVVTVKLLELVMFPVVGLTTVIGPLIAPDGTRAVIDVSEFTV